MHSLGVFLPDVYQIAEYLLEVRKEPGALPVFCPDVIDAFSYKNPVKSADFILTLKATGPNGKVSEEQQVFKTEDSVVLDYGTEKERLFLEADLQLKHWKIYTTYKDQHIDQWFNKIGNLFAWAMPGKGSVMLHGVLMEWQGKGIILTAASGTGKTTHARLWREWENAFIINGDRVLLSKRGNHWNAFGTPWSGSSGECINRKVSLDAVVFLSRGNSNVVKKISPLAALEKMLPRLIVPQWHKEYATMAVDLAIACLEDTPLFELHCLPDKQAVKVLKNAIFENL